jgi:phytanoyl-CoA hydroxylase
MTAASAAKPPSPHRSLDQNQIDFFRRHGYLKYGPLLEADLLEELRREYDRVFAAAQTDGRYRNLSIDDSDDTNAKRDAPQQMLQIMQMCERSLSFRRLLYHEAMLDIAEDLIGPQIQLFHDQALSKPAHHGGAVFWHQDNAYWRCLPANLISCWLTLDDVNIDNGAMHVIPDSHLAPLAHERSASTGALLDLGDAVETEKAVVIDLPAGGVMFHHCQTLHFTPPNKTERQRRALALHFMPPGTRSGSGEILGVSFGRPLLRQRL